MRTSCNSYRSSKEALLFLILTYIDYPYPIGLSKRIEALANALSKLRNLKVVIYAPILLSKGSKFKAQVYQSRALELVRVPLLLKIPYRRSLKLISSLLASLIVSIYAIFAKFH